MNSGCGAKLRQMEILQILANGFLTFGDRCFKAIIVCAWIGQRVEGCDVECMDAMGSKAMNVGVNFVNVNIIININIIFVNVLGDVAKV